MSTGGDHLGSSAGATKSTWMLKIASVAKSLSKAVPSLELSIVDVVTSCRQCHGPVRHNNDFCGQPCAFWYWERLRQRNAKASGKWLCSMPGCDKYCYVEKDGKVHDYCSKTHAEEHKAMKGSWFSWPWTSDTPKGTGGSSNPSSTAIIGGHSTRHDNTGPIYFYDKFAPYYEFTNFYFAPISLDERTWKTTEHYFQAQKFVGTPYLDVIQMCATPREAFDFSRKPFVSRWRRNDWEGVKIDIMRKALLAKFLQHGDLRKKLKGTGKRALVERSPYDKFWGDGGDGSGQNWLGRLLVEIRDAID